MDFYLPLNNPGTKNLSITLKIPLNTKPAKISYRKMKIKASRKQIKDVERRGFACKA
ncbi:MAG: hypothetical protein U5Q03_01060 [Bacteroidota bacterium]|nr:hypothetical protein [Bacteroidota bacterium]